MVIDLSVSFLGVRLKNPFLLASVPSARAAGFQKAAREGWGGGVIWGGQTRPALTFARGYIPREFNYIGRPTQWWAFQNTFCSLESVSKEQRQSPEVIEAATRKAKESGIAVFCTVAEAENLDAWVRDALAAERGGADFLELNMSCPWMPVVGLSVGLDLDMMKNIVKAIRKVSGLPIMVKLNAGLDRDTLVKSARLVIEAGAGAISVTNTLSGVIGVDIETGMPLACELNTDGELRGVISGISGPAIKPIGLRGVAELRRAVDVPISGIGGISDWQSAVEYMLLGATTVQIGTASMLYGYKMIKGLLRGLENYMERKGYKSVEDFVGKTTEKYAVGDPWTEPAVKQPRKMIVDEAKCTGCGLCVIACDASSSEADAIRVVDGVAKIDHNRCHTCNICRIVCPEQAISVTWEPAYLE